MRRVKAPNSDQVEGEEQRAQPAPARAGAALAARRVAHASTSASGTSASAGADARARAAAARGRRRGRAARHRPARSQRGRRAQQLVEVALEARRSASAGARIIQSPIGSTSRDGPRAPGPRAGCSQRGERVARHAQDRARKPRASPSQRSLPASRRGAARVVDQPELVDAVRSRPSISRSWRCRNRCRSHAASQAPPAARRRAATGPAASGATGAALQVGERQRGRHRPRAARSARRSCVRALGPQHEVGEVRRDHRRRADQQDQQHLQPPARGAPQRVVRRLRSGSECTRQLQRLRRRVSGVAGRMSWNQTYRPVMRRASANH